MHLMHLMIFTGDIFFEVNDNSYHWIWDKGILYKLRDYVI